MRFYASIIIFELIVQISKLSVDSCIIISVGTAPALETAITAASPLTQSIAAASRIPCMRIESGFAADIGHDAAGGGLVVSKSLCQIFKNIVSVFRVSRSRNLNNAGSSQAHDSGHCSCHNNCSNAAGCSCFFTDLTCSVRQIDRSSPNVLFSLNRFQYNVDVYECK